ncbi:hypothetical protein TNCV_707691 [Trichonephila clavipes]|nr:hypothetical protein TNCV_707691 [Trichonephila clavipes]
MRGFAAQRLFRVLPCRREALYIYKHPCLIWDSNPGPTAQQSASLTTIPDGRLKLGEWFEIGYSSTKSSTLGSEEKRFIIEQQIIGFWRNTDSGCNFFRVCNQTNLTERFNDAKTLRSVARKWQTVPSLNSNSGWRLLKTWTVRLHLALETIDIESRSISRLVWT